VQWCWKQGSTLGCNAMVCWSWGENDVEVRGVELVNCVEFYHAGPVVTTWRLFIRLPREWDAHADRGTCGKLLRGERKWKKISSNTWQILIGSLDFTHFNNLNSIISLQFYFFYQNSWFFLSINITWFIWFEHRKKKEIFHYLNIIIFLLAR